MVNNNPSDLVTWIESLIAENRRLADENHRLRLAAALRSYRKVAKLGRPKKHSVEADIQILEAVEQAMKEWNLRTRRAVLENVLANSPNRPVSPIKRKQKIDTLNKRLSLAKKFRNSSTK